MKKMQILFAGENSDIDLACLELKKNGIAFSQMHVSTHTQYRDVLQKLRPDIVISNYRMIDFSGLQAIEIAREIHKFLPVLILNGNSIEEAVASVKAGAFDYITKENLEKLPGAVMDAIRNQEQIQQQEEESVRIRENETRYKSLFEGNKSAMMLIDPINGDIIDVNEASCIFLNSTREEILSKNITEIAQLPPEELFNKMNLAVTEVQNSFEFQHVRSNGQIREVEVHTGPIYQHDRQLLYAIAYDVTEKRESEHELRKLFKAIEQSPLSIVITNTRGIIEYINPYTEQITGYSKDELIGQHTRIFKSGQTPRQTYKELWSTILAGKEWQGRLLNKKKNGELFWDSAVISPITNNAGNITHFVAIKENITDRLRMDLLEREIEVSKEAARFKQRFMANMSHEIRTPLTGIDGMVQILANTSLNTEQKDYLDTINISVKSLKEIVNQILDYSKIEAGKLQIAPKAFKTNNLIVKARRLFQSLTNSERELLLDADPDLPAYLLADENRIFQIITNFISNAIKYGGAVVKLNLTYEGRTPDEQMLFKVRVKDNGPGIPKELQTQLFDPFFMLNDANYKMIEGTGLGLAISKDLAEMLGGSIGVDSKPEEGTCFWFTFKASPARELKYNNQKPPIRHEVERSLHIMLVDDKVVNQKVVSLMLKNLGHQVMTAGNGQEALDQYKDNTFDLILMDIQMPVMDGITATQRFKQLHQNLPPIIGLSASAFEGDREKFMSQGMNDYLTKPLQQEDLFRILNKYFKK